MAKGVNKFVFHSFMCINCGNMAMSLPRQKSFQHSAGHRKKLYCPHCKMEINCVECKNDTEVFEFKNSFLNGEYENEKEESLAFMRMPSIG